MRTLIRSREFWLAVIIVAMIAATSLRAPGFASPGNLAGIVNDTAILMILALGQMAVILTRSIDLSMASNLALTGMIVALINAEGEWAIGLCGKDGNMVFAEKARKTVTDPDSNIERILDLGFVGEPVEVDRTLLDLLAKSEMIPVIAPVAPGRDGHTYNINADTFAGAIAGSLAASRLLFLTDVPGVLDKNGDLIKELTVSEARALIKDGTISGGMIPKVETCIDALQRGVKGVVIVNGKVPHAVLLELFTEHGAGTLIVHDKS